MARVTWYDQTIKSTLSALDTAIEGLTSKDAALRLKRYGPNAVTAEHPKAPWQLFFSQFRSPLIYLLLIAAVITFYLRQFLDAYVIMGVLLLNSIIGYVQEKKAEESLALLKQFFSQTTRVIRNGQASIVPVNDVTLGDIVELTDGSRVPADIRIIQSYGLKIDESVLTGESIPSEKTTDRLSPETPIARRTNLAFAGTSVVAGRGLGVIIAIGTETEFGHLAVATTKTESEETPLTQDINTLSRQLLVVVLAVVAVIAIVGIWQQRDPLAMFLTAVTAAVSAIPEGLPAIITIALSVGVYRMAQRKAIVRRLSAIETLGSTTLIASDKTGTLTENELRVEHVWLTEDAVIRVGALHRPEKILRPHLERLLRVGVLANDARINEQHQDRIIGDPTEGALLLAARSFAFETNQEQQFHPRIAEIPFHSNIRFMATAHAGPDMLVAVKGSVEAILERCTSFVSATGEKPLTPQQKLDVLQSAKDMAQRGYRTLAFADGSHGNKKLTPHSISALTFLGFVAMADTVRPSAIQAVHAAQRAGIRVIMITGDMAATAEAVAVQVGIAPHQADMERSYTASQLERMSLPQFEQSLRTTNVFAEIPPQLKLQIVEALQKTGEIVAVTGDGANDAPILKKAQVGVAMGLGGTDIARDAADVILADNNFATLVSAIEQGRVIYKNLQRVVWYLLATNIGELLVLLASLFAGLPLPLLPTQILWVNVVSEGTGTIGLALEPGGRNTLKERPRPLNEPFITQSMRMRILLVSVCMAVVCFWLFAQTLAATNSLVYARSVALAAIAALQIVNLFNARSLTQSILSAPLKTNPLLVISAFMQLLLTAASLELGALQSLFHTTSIRLNDWVLIAIGAIILTCLVECQKAVLRRHSAEGGALPHMRSAQ